MRLKLISTIKVVLVAIFVVGAFMSGWYSALTINGDPFLATMFKVKPPGYSSFIDDIVGAIENTRSPEQRVLSEQDNKLDGTGNETDSDFDRKYAVPAMGEVSNESMEFKITSDFTEVITEKMTPTEKAAFLVWLRSRFDMNEIDRLNDLLQAGLTPENSLEVYRNIRSNLKNQDYEYLLSIVDRFMMADGNKAETNYPEQYGFLGE